MKKTLYILIVLSLIAVFVLIFAYINQDKLIDRFIESQASNAELSFEPMADLDAITLVTVGTSAPLPSDRIQTCNAVFVNGKFFIFDVGEGAVEKLEDLKLPLADVSAVFISHWHSDHFIDLPGLINRSWQLGRNTDLHIYGPKGVHRVVNAIDSLLYDENRYRVDHHGSNIMDVKYASGVPHDIYAQENGMTVIYDEGGVTVSVFNLNHDPVEPNYGYRIDYKEKSLVYAGDCSYDERLVAYAQGADILVHEAMQKDFINRASKLQAEMGNTRNAQILVDIVDYHSTPEDAARIAEAAGVKKLILSHLAPVPENPISRRFYKNGLDEIYTGPILLAEDGDIYSIK